MRAPHDEIVEYLDTHGNITNEEARKLTGIHAEITMTKILQDLQTRGLAEPAKSWLHGTVWRKPKTK